MAKPVRSRTQSASARFSVTPRTAATLRRVHPPDAGGDHQRRPVAVAPGAEHDGFGDLRHRAADRRCRIGGTARAGGEFADGVWMARRQQRVPHTVHGAFCPP